MFRNWGLKKQFVTVFIVLITLPTIVFGFLIYDQTTKAFKQQAKDNTIARLEKNEASLISVINGVENMSSFMIYDENFRTFFMTSEEDMHQQNYKQAEKGIQGYFTFQLMSNNYIDSVELIAKDGHSLELGNPAKENKKEEKLDQAARMKAGAIEWSDSYQIETVWAGPKKIISLTRVINDINDITKPIGMVRIRLDQANLYKTIEANAVKQLGQYFVLSETGRVVLHRDSSLVGKDYPNSNIVNWVINSKKKPLTYQEDYDHYLVVKKKIKGTQWYSVALVNEGEVVHSLYNVRGLFVFMIIVLILLGILAFIGFYFSNVERIIELTRQTKQLESGDFTARVHVTSEDEIGKLGNRFNQMVITIQDYINREYKLKIKQKESELKALQSHIDPHFLYNTLDMIRWTARLENAMETGQLIERLSKIFRMNLNMGKMWVQIEEEIHYIQNYLELQKHRMGERLDYRIYYDSGLKDKYIIKQVLQPLVENSILHGLKNLPRQGIIQIRCYQVEAEVWIDVIDNGWGFSEDIKVNGLDMSKSYAINNLRERITIAFGKQYGLERVDIEVGAWMRLRLPLLDEENKNLMSKEQGE